MWLFYMAGPPGLEPGTSVLETEILPLNYGPVKNTIPCKNAILKWRNYSKIKLGSIIFSFPYKQRVYVMLDRTF